MDTFEHDEPSAEKDETEEHSLAAEPTVKIPVVIEELTEEQKARIAEIELFLDEHKVKVNRKKKKLLANMSIGPYETYKLGVVIANCCKEMALDKAYTSYTDAKSRGVRPNSMTFANLLSLAAGFGEQGSSLAPARTEIPPQNITFAKEVFTDMRAAEYVFSESTYTAMIRCYSENNGLEEAYLLHEEMKGSSNNNGLNSENNGNNNNNNNNDNNSNRNLPVIIPKIRTISPLLAGYSGLGNVEMCFKLFQELLEHNLIPSEKEYLSLLNVTVICKDLRFYSVLQQFMEDILLPSKAVWEAVTKWFLECENKRNNDITTSPYQVQESRVALNGSIALTGHRLLSVDLSDAAREKLLRDVSKFATQRTDGYTSHNKKSKSHVATPAALSHDIDGNSNNNVLNGGTGVSVGGVNNDVGNKEGNNSNNNNNNKKNNNKSNNDDKNGKSDGNEGNSLSSQGRMLSANNKHSFNKKTEIPNENENDNKDDSIVTGAKRERENNAEDSNTADNKKSKIQDEKNGENSEEISVDVERIKEKERVRKIKNASKTNKWVEFTVWVDKLVSDGEKADREAEGEKEGVMGENEVVTMSTDDGNDTNTTSNNNNTNNTNNNTNNIKKKCNRRYDVIVDGANVGYYKQNFSGAPSHIDYRQVDWMLRQLIERGFKPLLILHCRHLAPGVVPEDRKAIVESWSREGILYQTPQGCNDDWFWLYIAVALRCQVVTNDEMRDHHFQMLHARGFERWKERNQIHFSFGQWLNSIEDCCADKGGKNAYDGNDEKGEKGEKFESVEDKINSEINNLKDIDYCYGNDSELFVEKAAKKIEEKIEGKSGEKMIVIETEGKGKKGEIEKDEIEAREGRKGKEGKEGKEGKITEKVTEKVEKNGISADISATDIAMMAGKNAVIGLRFGKKVNINNNKVRKAVLKIPPVYSYRMQRLPPVSTYSERTIEDHKNDVSIVGRIVDSEDSIEGGSEEEENVIIVNDLFSLENVPKNDDNPSYYFPSLDLDSWLCVYRGEK